MVTDFFEAWKERAVCSAIICDNVLYKEGNVIIMDMIHIDMFVTISLICTGYSKRVEQL